jgi:hypothetical protein
MAGLCEKCNADWCCFKMKSLGVINIAGEKSSTLQETLKTYLYHWKEAGASNTQGYKNYKELNMI